MKHTLTLIFSIICFLSIAQETLEGAVLTNEDDQEIPLQGASVYWLGTQAGTTTNKNGQFNLVFQESTDQLVISFLGFKSDTIRLQNQKKITHFLISSEAETLDEVTLTQDVKRFRNPILKLKI